MSNRIKRISVFVLLFTMLIQLFGTVVSAEETAQQDIDLNDRIIEDFYNMNYIKEIPDIYKLNKYRDELTELEGYGNKSIDNLIQAIENSKKNSLEKLLFGLGIGGIGDKTALQLAKIFKNIDAMMEASFEEYKNIKDIGPTLAKNLFEYFHDLENIELINRLKELGVNMEYLGESEKYHEEITGKRFVLTGTLSFMDRDELSAILESYGGMTSSSVSKNTNVVIVGEKPGSKYDKAIQLGIEVWDEDKIKSIVDSL